MFDFQDQVAMVTGGSQGIGRAIADLFVESGAQVVILDMHPPKNPCKNLAYFACNVADERQTSATLAKVCEEFPHLSVLVNNAGITDDAVIWKMTREQWQRVLDVNLTGAFHTIRALAPHLREQRRGAIVNISSINGLRGKFGQANYAAAKAGLIALTKTVARELGRFNITVNCVAPGMVETEMTTKLDAKHIAQAEAEAVLGRMAKPIDIAQAVLFLSSTWARHITGTILKVDGGQYI